MSETVEWTDHVSMYMLPGMAVISTIPGGWHAHAIRADNHDVYKSIAAKLVDLFTNSNQKSARITFSSYGQQAVPALTLYKPFYVNLDIEREYGSVKVNNKVHERLVQTTVVLTNTNIQDT